MGGEKLAGWFDENDFLAKRTAGFGEFDADVSSAKDGHALQIGGVAPCNDGLGILIEFGVMNALEVHPWNRELRGARAGGQNQTVVGVVTQMSCVISHVDAFCEVIDLGHLGVEVDEGPELGHLFDGGGKRIVGAFERSLEPLDKSAVEKADGVVVLIDADLKSACAEEDPGGGKACRAAADDDDLLHVQVLMSGLKGAPKAPTRFVRGDQTARRCGPVIEFRCAPFGGRFRPEEGTVLHRVLRSWRHASPLGTTRIPGADARARTQRNED